MEQIPYNQNMSELLIRCPCISAISASCYALTNNIIYEINILSCKSFTAIVNIFEM